MKLITLIENNQSSLEYLKYEHGLSIYIECDNKKILFDTGESENFIKNAEALKVDLTKLDYIVLSHAHYDHCGGLTSLLSNYSLSSTLCLNENFFKFSDKFKFKEDVPIKYTGINFNSTIIKEHNIKVDYLKKNCTNLTEKIYLFTNFTNKNKNEIIDQNMRYKLNEMYFTDDFSREVVLGIDTSAGLLLIVGCAHSGIMNIIEDIKKTTSKPIFGVIGGTHLSKASDERILKTLEYFNQNNIKLAGLCHCSGDKTTEIFKKDFNGNFFINNTGNTLDFI
ncbi:MBL fold metallo-hydrolase [Clostridium sediminicola]|uniref:MBL fold metallo-hydrolase n=1 Tax=Clostridium sediminicola TaxID=3114879 RepID=UPI0031F21F0A